MFSVPVGSSRNSKTYENPEVHNVGNRIPFKKQNTSAVSSIGRSISSGPKIRVVKPFTERKIRLRQQRIEEVMKVHFDMEDTIPSKIKKTYSLKRRPPSPLIPKQETQRHFSPIIAIDQMYQSIIRCSTVEEVERLKGVIGGLIVQRGTIIDRYVEVLKEFKVKKGDRLYQIALNAWVDEPYRAAVHDRIDKKIKDAAEKAIDSLTESFNKM